MKKIITIILDGFGMREDIYGNAIKNAGMNNFINIWNNYPHCLLKANGLAVGLPEKQCSSSELGHKIIGAGREISNKLNDINSEFRKDNLKYNHKYNELIEYLKKHPNNKIHISILLSDGGVSSHINHLKSFLNELSRSRITNDIHIHAIADGRDSDKWSIKKYINEIDNIIVGNVKLSSICGRYYALDETKDYKRTKMYYDLLFSGRGVDAKNLPRVIEKCYEKKLSDEYLPPIKTISFEPFNSNDVFITLNYSKNNQVQLLNSICNKDFIEFNTYPQEILFYSLFEIDKDLNNNYFLENKIYNHTLTEYISELGLSQAHIYESIKAPSMNYHLQGDKYKSLEGCDVYNIASQNVDSFDIKPEMDSLSIAKTAIKCMEKDYDFIIVNFANPDEVGHTGNYQATINGLQAIDVCLGKIIEVAEENFYKVVITSSHSKADTIIDRQNNIVTKNTLSPVPFIIMDPKIKLENGSLMSFAPTLLKYMDIAIPKEMKNTDILITKK
ncbi:MAG: 2,3-bisphosphoglycerate-independent phosphoglycerate mutase [Candidatus Coprovivens sp.]